MKKWLSYQWEKSEDMENGNEDFLKSRGGLNDKNFECFIFSNQIKKNKLYLSSLRWQSAVIRVFQDVCVLLDNRTAWPRKGLKEMRKDESKNRNEWKTPKITLIWLVSFLLSSKLLLNFVLSNCTIALVMYNNQKHIYKLVKIVILWLYLTDVLRHDSFFRQQPIFFIIKCP